VYIKKGKPIRVDILKIHNGIKSTSGRENPFQAPSPPRLKVKYYIYILLFFRAQFIPNVGFVLNAAMGRLNIAAPA